MKKLKQYQMKKLKIKDVRDKKNYGKLYQIKSN